jgi:hypothetical protein
MSAIAYSGLPPQRLELEITESVLLGETEANMAILHQLRAIGARISMDDFGTGYSSLSYLRSFPFDKIKIDRSFVRDLAERPDCVAIIRAVAGLGARLGISTSAEGVETREQRDRLRAEGCTEAQGVRTVRPALLPRSWGSSRPIATKPKSRKFSGLKAPAPAVPYVGGNMELAISRKSRVQAQHLDPRERDVPAFDRGRPGARETVRCRIERPAADEMRNFGAAVRVRPAIGSDSILHDVHSLESEKPAWSRLGDVVAIHKTAFLMNCSYAPRRRRICRDRVSDRLRNR